VQQVVIKIGPRHVQTINIILIHIAYNNISFLQYGCGFKSSRGWAGRRDFFPPRPQMCVWRYVYQFAFRGKKKTPKHHHRSLYPLSGKSILRRLVRHHRFPPFTRRHDLCLSRLNGYKRSFGDTPWRDDATHQRKSDFQPIATRLPPVHSTV